MIRVVDLHKHFGGVRAVDGASLEIEQGAITGLIGPNGAGKTTLFNVIAGVYPPTSGRVYLADEEVTGMRPHLLFDRGLVRTFQIAQEFTTLTVIENLMASVGGQTGESLTGAWLRPGRVRAEEARIRRRAEEVIAFLDLGEVAGKPAGELSGGQKKLVELARVMMTGAKVVLLDEIGAGVNRTLLRSIAGAILRLNIERGYTFCMIEHDMDLVSLLCDPVVVMTEGRVLTQGPAPDVQADERVIEAYLGTRARSAPS
ncbi:MAG: ABC transporter ATP-binding protein [Defluviicoccus sp.]|nr:ABC transporter ATP-binding protein [Defluviicoccus sp.]MDE0383038.1 ABC transporter ATP-binding protein [Defluviicoccus sp.]